LGEKGPFIGEQAISVVMSCLGVIVVSDTSALTSLLQIGLGDILRRLFDQVVIPEAVELAKPALNLELGRLRDLLQWRIMRG
jgi:hypothetical protein